MSFVYPNPAYVATAYPGGEGGDYQLTGRRRSQAKPLLGVDASFAGSIRTWDTAECVRVAVLDTGHAAESDAILANPFTAVDGDPDLGMDADGDGYLDPVAGHGTFIGGLIARIAPGCGLMVEAGADELRRRAGVDHRHGHPRPRRPGPRRTAAHPEPVVQRLHPR